MRSIGAAARYTSTPFVDTSIWKHEALFSNRSKIIALPALPETARSYEGDVLLDEFAFHQDGRAIYQAVGPSIARGYSISIISTPNGQQGAYYDLAKEAGLVDNEAATERWSTHKVDIYQAIEQGCRDRNGNPLDANELRLDCLDEEMWLQEFCCQFLSIASQWIAPELFEKCVDLGASVGDPDPELTNLFAGWDVARHKDLSVVWFSERLGDVSWTRGVVDLSRQPTPVQTRFAMGLMRQVRRMCVDQTGMGLAIYETLAEKYGKSRVEGVTFTLASKEAMAVHAKNRMEQGKVRLPDSDLVRNSFRSLQKTTSPTGQARFDAQHDEKKGHADHWWAFALAENAAYRPGDAFLRWLINDSEKKPKSGDLEERERTYHQVVDAAGRPVDGDGKPLQEAQSGGGVKPDAPLKEGESKPFAFTDPHGILRRPSFR